MIAPTRQLRRITTPPRIALVCIVVGYFALLIGLGGYTQWDRLGVPARGTQIFLDLRSVTSAWECRAHDVPVLPKNPCDPLQRPANYPRIWTWPGELGAGQGATVALGYLIGAIFLVAAILALPRRASLAETAVYGLVLCSPAVMLGVARANVDLLVFALVALAVFQLSRGRAGSAQAHGLFLLAALLKLFPIFATGALVRQKPRNRLLLVGVFAVFALYALLSLNEIRTIRQVTPEVNGYSYGVHLLGWWLSTSAWSISSRAWDLTLIAAVVLVGWLASPSGGRASSREDLTPDAQRVTDSFAAGAGIYVLTYALFRSYDYRLAFLLLTVPQLIVWARQRRAAGAMAIFALLATVWLSTPWGGLIRVYYAIVRVQDWIALYGPFKGRLPLEAIPQFVLCAVLIAGLVTVLLPTRVRDAVQARLRHAVALPQR